MENFCSKQIRLQATFKVLSSVFAFFLVHAILRFVLLFRNNPYGIPFVAKPDWYIFHALCIDFIWISKIALPFLLLAFFLREKSKLRYFIVPVFCIIQAIILPFTLLDNEFQRFLGTHFSISLLDTYKDVSSLAILPDYVASDLSIPYLQWVLLVGIIPFSFVLYRIIYKIFEKHNIRFSLLRVWLIVCVSFFLFSELFLNVIWKGTNRMRKLQPVVEIILKDVKGIISPKNTLDPDFIKAATLTARRVWLEIEGDSDSIYEYPDENYPLYRIKKNMNFFNDSISELKNQPNFIVIFMESHRGMDVGFMNESDNRESPTPVLDSLSREGYSWMRFYASGVPTVGGVLSTHFGIPPHRFKQTASELTYANIPSFASILRDFGYKAHFFAAADPAWDNLSVWFQRWYDKTHYNRIYEDDSTFFDVTAEFICDSLGYYYKNEHKPFLAAMITRSNHYPFNLVPNMSDSLKALSQEKRMRYTMHWADSQMGRFLDKLKDNEWFKNTYVIVLGDHGFPQGEHGVSTIGSDAYSNVTWIPFVINGPRFKKNELENNTNKVNKSFVPSSQCDVAPTILDLANLNVPNSFMGHSLIKNKGFAIGSHSGKMALSIGNYRMLSDTYEGAIPMLFKHETDIDVRFDIDLLEKNPELLPIAQKMKSLADTLLTLNDWILEKNRVEKPNK